MLPSPHSIEGDHGQWTFLFFYARGLGTTERLMIYLGLYSLLSHLRLVTLVQAIITLELVYHTENSDSLLLLDFLTALW